MILFVTIGQEIPDDRMFIIQRKERSMLALRRFLNDIQKGLENLIEKTKEMEGVIETIESVLSMPEPRPKMKVKPGRKRGVKKPAAGKRSAKRTVTESILNIIGSSSQGVDTAEIKEKTGFDNRKIWGGINNLKRQGKVKSAGKGIYIKV